jgi:hypothetical protein
MLYHRFLHYFFCISTVSIIFTSEKLPLSFPKIFSENELQLITLPYPYYSMTEEEKNKAIFLGDGCYTILKNEGDCTLVGPLRPCQLILLTIKEGPTIVIHATYNSNFATLLHTIKAQYAEYNLQETVGELFTIDFEYYTSLRFPPDLKLFSFQNFYNNRSQIEELEYKSNLIQEIFNIHDHTKIIIKKFKNKEINNYALQLRYIFFSSYVFIKHLNEKTIIYNSCPLTENYWGNTAFLSINELNIRMEAIKANRMQVNPFLINLIFSTQNTIEYGSIPFVYIPVTKN